jgi:hypothetical protein
MTGVAVKANVVVNFSEPMNPASVSFSCLPDPGGWSSLWNAGNASLTCAHSTNFSFDTVYTFTVLSGDDKSGNALVPGAAPNPWSFVTEKQPLTVSLINPSSGETLAVGENFKVNWTVAGGTAPYTAKLELSTTPTPDFNSVIASGISQNKPGKGSYTWVVPDKQSDTCLVRLTVSDSGGVNKTSTTSTGIFRIRTSEWSGLVTGKVTDKSTGAALSSANVTMTGLAGQPTRTSITNATGYYSLTLAQPGLYTLNVTRDGYEHYSEQVTINSTTTKNIQLKPLKKDANGFPLWVAGAVTVVVLLVVFILLFLFLASGRKKKTDSGKKAEPASPPRASARAKPRPVQPSSGYQAQAPERAAQPAAPAPTYRTQAAEPAMRVQHPAMRPVLKQEVKPRIYEASQPQAKQRPPPPPPYATQPKAPEKPQAVPVPPAAERKIAPAKTAKEKPGLKCPKCGGMNDYEDHECFWCGAVI